MGKLVLLVDAVAGRRLAAPKGADYQYIATVSAGDFSVTTKPVQCVSDSKLGSSVAFRDKLRLEIEGEEYDPWLLGVTVDLRSSCGTVHFGMAACRSSRKWFPLVPSCGEVLCNFTLTSDDSDPEQDNHDHNSTNLDHHHQQPPRLTGNGRPSSANSVASAILQDASRLNNELSVVPPTTTGNGGRPGTASTRPGTSGSRTSISTHISPSRPPSGSRPASRRPGSGGGVQQRGSSALVIDSSGHAVPRGGGGGGSVTSIGVSSSSAGSPTNINKNTPSSSSASHQHSDEAGWAGTLTVHLEEINGLTIPTSRLTLFAVIQFSMNEKRTDVAQSTVHNEGHSASWVVKGPVGGGEEGGDSRTRFGGGLASEQQNRRVSNVSVGSSSSAHMIPLPIDQQPNALSFDIVPYALNRTVTVKVYGYWNGRDQPEYIGGASTQITSERTVDTEKVVVLSLTDHPLSQIVLRYHLAFSRPRVGDGRPMSAHPTRRPGTATKLRSQVQSATNGKAKVNGTGGWMAGGESSGEDEIVFTNNRGVPVRDLKTTSAPSSSVYDGKAHGPSTVVTDPPPSTLVSSIVLERVEAKINEVVTNAVDTVLSKLVSLEKRVANTEELVGQLKSAGSGNYSNSSTGPTTGYLPTSSTTSPPTLTNGPSVVNLLPTTTTVTTTQGAAAGKLGSRPGSGGGQVVENSSLHSRPSSAESVSTAYDVSQSLVTEQQLRTKFRQFDTAGIGYMSKQQMIQFYRQTSLFGQEESEGSIVRELLKYCPGLNQDLVTFDEFAKVSLRLASR